MCFSSSIFLFAGKHIDEEDQCAENEFLCDHDKCILKSHECDGTVDCNDGTDELNCRDAHQGLCTPFIIIFNPKFIPHFVNLFTNYRCV